MAAPAKVAKQEGKNNHESADERAGECQCKARNIAMVYMNRVPTPFSVDLDQCGAFHARSPFHFVPASSEKHG